MITNAQAQRLMLGTRSAPFVPIFNELWPEHGITTPRRIAAFLAQVGHESLNFTRLVENMNYSAQRLAEVWPGRFAVNSKAEKKVPNSLALSLAGKPEAIGNHVYANRMGNGPIVSGDGFRFRGRGAIHVTGRGAYLAYSMDEYGDDRCVKDPDLLAQPLDAAKSALWFWTKNNLNSFSDTGNIRGQSRVINGGFNGLADRLARYERYCLILGA